MRKTKFTVAVVCALAASMMLPSCIGSFTLTNKLLSWNKTVGDKFINELVFFAFWIVPVYEVAALADVVVLNSIEFWSGDNPVASGTKVIQGNDGKYFVTSDKTGYTIESENDGSIVRLEYNKGENSWGMLMPNGETQTIFTFVDDSHIALPTSTGEFQSFELSQAGLYAYQQVATASCYAMK